MSELTRDEISRLGVQYISDSKEHSISASQMERAQLYQDFIRGGTHMWDEGEWNIYKESGITPISINRCKPVLKGLLGMYSQSKQEVRVRPRRGGSAVVAQVHTELLKHTQDLSYGDYQYAQIFMRGGIDTESYFRLWADYSTDDSGQLRFCGRSLWDVRVDRNATEYDLNISAKYVIDREWTDIDDVMAMYPDMQRQLKAQVDAIDADDVTVAHLADRLATYLSSGGKNMSDSDDVRMTEQIPDEEMVKKYRYLLQHVYWKESFPELVIVDNQTGQSKRITKPNRVKALGRRVEKTSRFRGYRAVRKVLHESIFLRNALLEDRVEPLGPGVSDYPIVRYAPMWDQGYAMGFVDDLVSLNKEENSYRTQTLRLLGQTANSGWKVAKQPSKQWETLLQRFGSQPGVIIPEDKYGGSVEKITPNRLSEGHFTIGRQFEMDVKRVSGVDDASLGYETGKNESGRAIGLKMQNNRSSNQIFFDMFYRSLEIFGQLLLKAQMAGGYYTADEIYRVVSESSMIDPKMMARARFQLTSQIGGVDLPQPQMLAPPDPAMFESEMMSPEQKVQGMATIQSGLAAQQQYNQSYGQLNETFESAIKSHAIELLLQQLNEDKGQYGLKATISPSAPTERMSQFLQMDALLSKYGQLIPPDVFIDLTDLPQKEEIKARMLQQQAALQTQQAQQQSQAA